MANEEMIQTHVDNFLAKIAGETPIDDNPRNSTEFWLNEIAKWTAGQSTDDASTKKVYWHTIKFTRQGASVWYATGYMIVLTTQKDPLTSTQFEDLLKIDGFWGLVINGFLGNTQGGDESSIAYYLEGIYTSGVNTRAVRRSLTTFVEDSGSISIDNFSITDLGSNPIN